MSSQTWLTQEAADRLAAELTNLESVGRTEVIKKIEARIRQLKQMLENATIGAPPASADGVVGAGMVVSAIVADDEMKFLLGSREISTGDLDVYSEKSPLGAAVLGAKIGDKVSYTLPNGKSISVEILGAEFFA